VFGRSHIGFGLFLNRPHPRSTVKLIIYRDIPRWLFENRTGEPMSEQSDKADPKTGDSLIAATANLAHDSCDDALMAGAASMADIDRLMDDLQIARDYLQSEGEKLQRMASSYAHLARTASASAKVITESLGSWRLNQTSSSPTISLPQAPSLSPD
jgi:hypothetical protein